MEATQWVSRQKLRAFVNRNGLVTSHCHAHSLPLRQSRRAVMLKVSSETVRIARLRGILLTGAMAVLPLAAQAQTQPVETIVVTSTRASNAASIAPSIAPLAGVQPPSG